MEESLMLEEILQTVKEIKEDVQRLSKGKSEVSDVHCNEHGVVMEKGVSKTKFNADGSPKTYLFHKVDGKMCFGKGVTS